MVKFIERHADQDEVTAFVHRMDEAMDPGEQPLTESELKSEFDASLLSDHAYRNPPAAAGAEFSARGGQLYGLRRVPEAWGAGCGGRCPGRVHRGSRHCCIRQQAALKDECNYNNFRAN